MRVILLSSTNDPINGYGNFTHELCSYFQDKIDFTLLLPVNSPNNAAAKYRIKKILPEYIYSFKTPKILAYYRFLYREKADIVHALTEFPYMLLAQKIAASQGKPLVISTQGTYAVSPLVMWPEKYFVKKCYEQAAIITSPSEFTKTAIESVIGRKDSIRVIHNGVNFKRFQKKCRLDKNKKVIQLLTVGGIKPRRGQDLVIEALREVIKERKDFHYYVVGFISPWGKTLQKKVAQYGLGKNITFTGPKVGDELVSRFQSCDIYIQTPRMATGRFEGFGIVFLEASACGKPIIAADSGGVRDAVVDGKTGVVIPPENPSAIADAVLNLLSSEELRQNLGQNGYNYAKNHDWEIIGNKYLNLYKSLS